jgi:hypothetical protein
MSQHLMPQQLAVARQRSRRACQGFHADEFNLLQIGMRLP